MIGKCLCGEVSFEILQEIGNIYRCHCHLCQKQTGASANAATFIDKDSIRWLSGESLITHYAKKSGFRTNFCSLCGSPVPNPLRETDYYWIPVGLLENPPERKVVAHICTSSKSIWEIIPADDIDTKNHQFPELPAFDELNERLIVDE